jgi:Zn-dependent protease
MRRIRIGKFFGIGVFLHWSFFLLLAWIAWQVGAPLVREHGWNGAMFSRAAEPFLVGVLFVSCVFLCVVLHEFGHALAARRYGVRTRDITLYPIGGVARLECLPERPTQELVVALAGPVVNFVIAAALWAVLLLLPEGRVDVGTGGLPSPQNISGFLSLILVTNIFLVAFNLIPAFPMDGGRILRALLAYRLDFGTATRIAAGVGQLLAGAFFVLGLLGNPFLMIIAVFVFLGATAESRAAQLRGGLSGIPVRDAMVTTFSTLAPEDTLQRASEALLAGAQQDFPVVSGSDILGILTRENLVTALAGRGLSAPIGDQDMLFRVLQLMQEAGSPIAAVLRDRKIVGLVTSENIQELMMIRTALRKRPLRRPAVRPVPNLPAA